MCICVYVCMCICVYVMCVCVYVMCVYVYMLCVYMCVCICVYVMCVYTNTLYTNTLYTNTLYTNTLYTNTLYTNTHYIHTIYTLQAIEGCFIFATVWSVGACVDGEGRVKFDLFLRKLLDGTVYSTAEYKDFKIKNPSYVENTERTAIQSLPEEGLAYDYLFECKSAKWVNWLEGQPVYKIPKEAQFNRYVCVYVCVCVGVCICVCMYVCVCMCECMYVTTNDVAHTTYTSNTHPLSNILFLYTHTYTHTYIHTYTHTHIHTYTHIHTHTHITVSWYPL
jgi:hypothetical protein